VYVSLQGIEPLNPWKTQKVRVSGMDRTAKFDGESSQVGIGGEIAALTFCAQKIEEKFRVTRTGIEGLYDSTVQPGLHVGGGAIDGHGIGKDARAGPETDESQRDHPGDANGRGAG